MASQRSVGIDVGGTSIKAGASAPDGAVIERRELGTEARDREALLAGMAALARELGAREHLGIGVPGLLEHASGRIAASPNLPALVGVCLPAEIAGRLGWDPARVQVENDANVAALGEAWRGALRGVRHGLMLTLGTGVGGGLVLDGELYLGEDMAGEPGHLVIEPGGLLCNCGSRGCLEMYASGTAAERRARERGLPAQAPGDVVLLTRRALAGAAPEAALLAEIGRDLGRGIGLVLTLLDVRTFVFGGGFSAALPALEAGIRAGLCETSYGRRLGDVLLKPAELGEDAGWIGAARLGALAAAR